MKEAVPCRVPRLRALVLLVLSAVSLPHPAAGAVEAPDPPVTRAEQVVDDVHGVEITDPYRWLEDGSSEEVRRWVESQSAYTRGLLEARPGRDAARRRLAKLLSIGTLTAPTPKGGRYFYTRREGEQNQPILYVRDSLKGKDRALVDPNALSPDGTAAIDWWYPSEDGSLLAYGVSMSGDEKSTLRVLDVATGKALADVIPHTRYCTLGWLPDKSGFYYTRYPAPGEVPAGQENYNRHVFFHRLGSDWTADPKIYGEKRKPEEIIEFTVSPDGRFMVVWVLEGWSRSDLYVRDLKTEGSPFVPVAEGIDALFHGEVIGGTLYLYDLKTGATTLWDRVESDLDLKGMEVHQVFYRSKDGTRVPMFLVHRKGLRLDGDNPTVLYGYGGFNISLTPAFSRSVVLWLERGGIYAVANLRGGGEYGEDWHRAGMLERKQNVFDDFIAAAEWLIEKRYTRPGRLAIYGASNGGLLVGAAFTQRPDLFHAVVCSVPLLDMVRYHNFQIARLWVPEYGSPENPDQFRVLYAYSPYHRVKDNTPYPAVLVETAESDSRVDPMHARKMTARLQKASSSKRPILLRTETRAGHGIGKPLAKLIDEATDTWTFLMWQLGLEPGPSAAPGR